jgi:quinol-cytochrome oxidoreductase complex cytochrome b subunit
VQFATTCGPIPCWLAGAFAAAVGAGVFAAVEYVGYRLATGLFPDNALKRSGLLGYVTVLNLFLAPLLALLLFALFP